MPQWAVFQGGLDSFWGNMPTTIIVTGLGDAGTNLIQMVEL
jgi:hypothetical protein